MEAAEREQERRRLKKRLESGAINQGVYDGLLAALERREAEVVEHQTLGATPTRAGVGDTSPANQPSLGALKTAAQSLSPGTEIGTFRIHETIGEGGMGMVWKAYDVQGERFVALKLLPPALAASAEEVARVKDVFQRVHALNHQYICPVYLFGTDPRFGPYLVMKYIDGSTLSAYRRYYARKTGNFPLSEVVRTLRPVAAALDYAHTQKVIHRDIKPQNILLSRDGRDVQVVDFGLAAEIRSSMTRVSRVRMDTSGTYPYMAPEQWRGQYQDGKTDQYQLAVVAYELLAGHLPFEAPDNEVLRLCVLQEPVSTLPEQRAFVNQALSRALAKDRAERFADCRAFVQALDETTPIPAVLAVPAVLPVPVLEAIPVPESVVLPAEVVEQKDLSQRGAEERRILRPEPPREKPVAMAELAEPARSRESRPPRSERRRRQADSPKTGKPQPTCCGVLVGLFFVVILPLIVIAAYQKLNAPSGATSSAVSTATAATMPAGTATTPALDKTSLPPPVKTGETTKYVPPSKEKK